MKALAAKIVLQLLKWVGLKTLLKMGWSKVLYPALKKLADKSEQGWDNKLLKFVDDNIYKVINSI